MYHKSVYVACLDDGIFFSRLGTTKYAVKIYAPENESSVHSSRYCAYDIYIKWFGNQEHLIFFSIFVINTNPIFFFLRSVV